MAVTRPRLLNTQPPEYQFFGGVHANRKQAALADIVSRRSSNQRLAFAANTFDGSDAPPLACFAKAVDSIRVVAAIDTRCPNVHLTQPLMLKRRADNIIEIIPNSA